MTKTRTFYTSEQEGIVIPLGYDCGLVLWVQSRFLLNVGRVANGMGWMSLEDG